MFSVLLGSVLPWLLVAVGAILVLQLIRQNGRILLRLESIEQRLQPRSGPARSSAPGLSIGAPAPEFELPDLSGAVRKFSDFRGRDLLLIFFNPTCGFCTKMAAELAALPTDGRAGCAVPVVVTTGDVEANRTLVRQHGIRGPVLIQQQMEVANQYRAQGTPMGYRIDAGGRIASELTVGGEALLRLASGRPPGGPGAAASGRPAAHEHKEPDPSLARSRLNRNGLNAGMAAPEFRLPAIDGAELALTDFHGRHVLLVFSDPECGPCDELAPRLQRLHEHCSDLQVLVVSRRDPEATREKADELGLTYPIVMQKQWELSLKYGMFATPIGYLIDEQGVLLSDVAVGVEPILRLADRGATSAAEFDETSRNRGQLLTTS